MPESKLRILIVDDTVVYRKILSDVVESLPDAQLLGTAPHGRLALAKLADSPADLVLLDLEMPEMDGLETLQHIRSRFPSTGVVLISGNTTRAASLTVQALEMGALDFIRKPEGSDPEQNRKELREHLRPILRLLQMRLNLQGREPTPALSKPSPLPSRPLPVPQVQRPIPIHTPTPRPNRIDVIGIGVSTGGPNALVEVIPRLPANLGVPILLVQHMPPMFTASLAENLDVKSVLTVVEAREGEEVRPNQVYIAPGGRHMVLRRRPESEAQGPALIIGLNDNPPENSCRPSVDVLFRSMATHYPGNMLGVIMTGMGNDGLEGIRTMKRKGCYCLTQSESSCVVYGMPMAVDEAGLSDESVELGNLASRMTTLVRSPRFL